MTIRSFGALLFAIFTWTSALAADARLPVPGGGELLFAVPDGWQSTSPASKTPTMTFTPVNGKAFMVVVSTYDPGAGPRALFLVREQVAADAEAARTHSVELFLQIKNIRSTSAYGQYFSATDKAPKAGEFKYLTQGIALIEGQPLRFTILNNVSPDAVSATALHMIEVIKFQR